MARTKGQLISPVGILTVTGVNVTAGVAQTSLVVQGNARITGILTVGTSSLTFDGNSDRVTIGTGVTIQSGIISATDYYASAQRRVVAFTVGTTTLFHQAAAPTGWTKSTSHNNKALRVVSGTGGGSGGSVGFTTAFTSRSGLGTVAATTLTSAQIPAHTHGYSDETNSGTGGGQGGGGANTGTTTLSKNTDNGTGGNGSHTHGFSLTMDFDVQYIDMIVCSIN